MAPQLPHITHPGNCYRAKLRNAIFGRGLLRRHRSSLGCFFKQDIGLGNRKARVLDLDPMIDQGLHLAGQQVRIPACVQSDLVVGDEIGPALDLIEVREADCRDGI